MTDRRSAAGDASRLLRARIHRLVAALTGRRPRRAIADRGGPPGGLKGVSTTADADTADPADSPSSREVAR
jgi:hypothetical protein